ncbi:MAG TPA: hypothetical protein VMV81_05760 [Phycisphaerae bacterium]|nr:hypothetical protein [Phycisphaerae bacterium]
MKNPHVPLIAILALVAGSLTLAQTDTPPSHPPASQPVTDTPPVEEPQPPHEPTAAEILKQLSRDENAPPRPVVRPFVPGQNTISRASAEALPRNNVVPVNNKLYPDGYRIVDRPGRLTREGDYYTFSFETRTEAAPELPVRLLPNRLLEDMEIASAGGTKSVVFLISGELTEYHGVNYLLLQKLLTRPNLGNLK